MAPIVGTATRGASKIFKRVQGVAKRTTGAVQQTTEGVETAAAQAPGPVGPITSRLRLSPHVANVRRTLSGVSWTVRLQLAMSELLDWFGSILAWIRTTALRVAELLRGHGGYATA